MERDSAGRDDPAEALTDRYDREAGAYLELWAPILRTAGRKLLAELDGPARRVLDVGAGVGALLPDLSAAFPGASIVGVDRSPGMLALASERYGRAVMDARCLAFPAACVDRVLMAFMLFHLESPLEGLREARRVLRGGGRVGTLTWAGELDSGAIRIWNQCLEAHGAAPPDPAMDALHEAVDTPEKMEALLGAAGFWTVRAWADGLDVALEPEHLIHLKTRMGSGKPRFESMGPEARLACVAEARRRMAGLSREDLAAHIGVVYSVGRA